MSRIRKQFSPAMAVGLLALFVALGGSAYAIGKNSVGTNQLKNNAVTTKKIKKNAVTTSRIRGYERIGVKRVKSVSGADYDVARMAAKQIKLFSAGPFTIYGKCFHNETDGYSYASVYVKTSENGSLFDSDEDGFDGNPFLDKSTAENDREANYAENSGPNDADYYGMHSTEISLMSPSGTVLEARVPLGVKTGNLPGGNGAYKGGDVCVFAGDMTVFNK